MMKVMNEIISKRRGFTLVELLVGISVLAILLAGVFGILSAALPAFGYNFTQNRNVEDARMAINALADELRYAMTITNGPANGATLNVSGGQSLVYVVSVNGTTNVTRTLTRAASGTDTNTFVLQGNVVNSAYPSYRFGKGIVTGLSVSRTDLTEKRMLLRVSITTNDTSYVGGQSVTTTIDVIPLNIALP